MGYEIFNYYKYRIESKYKLAFFSTFVITLLIHLYKFTNTLPNHDSLLNYYSSQNMLSSGRWALSVACGISSYWDLPWVNGILSCFFIALTTVVLVELFKMDNPVLIMLSGALLASSASTTETLFFLYTADGYFMAMFLAALGVFLSKIDENSTFRIVISGVCFCIACAIYQAYISFALVLTLCYLFDVLLKKKYNTIKDCYKWIVRQGIIFALSLFAYYFIWKILLYLSRSEATSYQGIAEVGKITPQLIIGGINRSLKSIILYFLQWDVLEHGFTLYSVLNIIFLILMIVGLGLAVIRSEILKQKWAAVLLIFCLIAIIPFSCIWSFVSASVSYKPMMLQCLTIWYIAAALLFEQWAKNFLKNVIFILLLLSIFNNALMANISYYYLNLGYERTFAEGVEMMIKIHDFQEKNDIKWITVLGSRIEEVQWENSYSSIEKENPSKEIHMFSEMIESNFLFDSEHTIPFLQNYLGLKLNEAPKTMIDSLKKSSEVMAMGCWPRSDAMMVIDNILVIKLSNVSSDN